MKPVFDPYEAIEETVAECVARSGRLPGAILVSPRTYRRLLEVQLSDAPGAAGVSCITQMATDLGTVDLVIDELQSDYTIRYE